MTASRASSASGQDVAELTARANSAASVPVGSAEGSSARRSVRFGIRSVMPGRYRQRRAHVRASRELGARMFVRQYSGGGDLGGWHGVAHEDALHAVLHPVSVEPARRVEVAASDGRPVVAWVELIDRAGSGYPGGWPRGRDPFRGPFFARKEGQGGPLRDLHRRRLSHH
jgi:hypothetical protein